MYYREMRKSKKKIHAHQGKKQTNCLGIIIAQAAGKSDAVNSHGIVAMNELICLKNAGT